MSLENKIETMPSAKIISEIERAFGVSDLCFIRKMENIVYRAKLGNETVFVRLTSPLRRTKSEIEAELDWIFYLAKNGLPVVNALCRASGEQILTIKDKDQQFEVCLFPEVKGEHPTEEQATDGEFLFRLGSLIGKMHKITKSYHPLSHVNREEWFNERGLRHAKKALAVSQDHELKGHFDKILRFMESLSKTKANYGLIHADITIKNLFIKDDNSIWLIDFDDSCYHWHIFDLVIAIFSIAGQIMREHFDDIEQHWLNHLIAGYRSVYQLSDEEISLIPYFLDFAYLRIYFWIEDHQSLDTFHEEAKLKVQELKEWAKRRHYDVVSQTSLELLN